MGENAILIKSSVTSFGKTFLYETNICQLIYTIIFLRSNLFTKQSKERVRRKNGQ